MRTVNLQKTFITGTQELHILNGINIEIRSGEIVAIVGASGVGKSTLLNLLGTLDRPTKGTVIYGEEDVFQLSSRELAKFRNMNLGFVFQFHYLLPEFSALENVMMPALIAGKKKSEAREMAFRLLEKVGLEGRGEHRPGKLSGGEQQRVAVARALINDPEMVLADEPTGNLDRKTGEGVHHLLWDLNRRMNQTFVIATHNENLARRCDRIIRLADGQAKEVTAEYKNGREGERAGKN